MISADMNRTSLDSFNQYVVGVRSAIKRQYDRSVNKDLSRQQWQGLFQRNVTSVLKQVYQDAVKELRQLSFATDEIEGREGAADLSTFILKSFDGIVEELIHYALQKHRSSCAMSNFPDEHNPSQDYLFAVIQETGRDWSAFAAQVDAMLSGRE